MINDKMSKFAIVKLEDQRIAYINSKKDQKRSFDK